jgi:hypothetical protein
MSQIVDTSETEHRVLVTLESGIPKLAVPVELLPAWFRTYFPAIVQRISDHEPKFG